MSELSPSYPHIHYPEEAFDINSFNAKTDRVSAWRSKNVPWKRVQPASLHARHEFMPGSGYGRNLWDELYKGETITRLYVALPESLVANFNVLVEYHGQSMAILQHAAPDFAKPRRMDRVELMNYYRWMGASL